MLSVINFGSNKIANLISWLLCLPFIVSINMIQFILKVMNAVVKTMIALVMPGFKDQMKV